MPSMHCVWALWCACVLVPRVKHQWVRVCAIIYPMVTVLAIVLTGNHYALDAVGGVVALRVGYGVARVFTHNGRRPASLALVA